MNQTGALFHKKILKIQKKWINYFPLLLMFTAHSSCFFFFLGKVLQVPSVEELSTVSRHVLHDIAPLPMGIKAMCIVGGSKHSLTAKRQAHWHAGTPDHVSMAVPAEL